MQEGFVRSGGYQLTQWTAAHPPPATTDLLENLFVIRKSSLGESLVGVATLADFVAYPSNELKYFECKGPSGYLMFSALPGDVLRITPAVPYWVQTSAPYANCNFTVSSIGSFSGTAPALKVGNYLQLTDHLFTDDDLGRWLILAGFSGTPAYNAPVEIVTIVSGHTALVRFADDRIVTTNETGTAWTRKRLVITTAVDAAQEPRYFPTVERSLPWELERDGSFLSSGSSGNTSRFDPSLAIYRDRRFTSMLPSLDAALALAATTKAAVALLQATADTNNTSFLGVTQTDYPG